MIAIAALAGSTIESVFAASLASGFAFSLILFLTAGRFHRPRIRFLQTSRGRTSRRGHSGLEALPGLLPASLGVFATGFGLFGLFLREQIHCSQGVSLLGAIGLASGFTLLFAVSFARLFSGTAQPIKGGALLGAIANVSLTIPASGVGAIAYEKEGKRHTIAARAANGEELQQGHRVMVMQVRDGVATVEEF